MRPGRPAAWRTSPYVDSVTVDLLRWGDGDPNASTLHERLAAVRLLVEQGESRREIASRLDVTVRSVERYIGALRQQGVLA